MTILSRTALAAQPCSHRQNWAFARGGSYDICRLADGTVIAAVDDPETLTDAQRAEIAKALPAEPSTLNSQLSTSEE